MTSSHFPRTTTHTLSLKIYAPACTTQLVSCLLDKLRSVLPRFPDATALTFATSLVRLGFDFRTLLPLLFKNAVRTPVEEFGRTTLADWAAVGAPRGVAE
jgi:hypothetical protein